MSAGRTLLLSPYRRSTTIRLLLGHVVPGRKLETGKLYLREFVEDKNLLEPGVDL
jgi:hypothetical protein